MIWTVAKKDLRLLMRAHAMAQACGPAQRGERNPGVWLGAVLGALAKGGRDKVTLIIDRPVRSVGLWVEQLVAESTGKEGKGLVPVESEPLGAPAVYGPDRVFVWLSVGRRANTTTERQLRALERAGHPVVRLVLQDAFDLGAELFRWEVATVTASALLGINPFDEPNVKESKDNTTRLLDMFQSAGRLPQGAPLLEIGGMRVSADAQTGRALAGAGASLENVLEAHLAVARPGDYVAITAYLHGTPERERLLQSLRLALRNRLRAATTVGYGPRFLHSTGQLHKGGPGHALFLQLVGGDADDLAIPGVPYSFGTLKQAQALGDFQSLQSKQRRVLRIGLGRDLDANLRMLVRAGTMPRRRQRLHAAR